MVSCVFFICLGLAIQLLLFKEVLVKLQYQI